MNVAIVQQKGVGQAGNRTSTSSLSLTIGSLERLPEVMTRTRRAALLREGGGRNYVLRNCCAALRFFEQQNVQRCVGQHDADVVVAGGDEVGERTVGPFAQEDDGALAAGEQRLLLVVEMGKGADGLDVRAITANGLSTRPLRSRSVAAPHRWSHRRPGESRPAP